MHPKQWPASISKEEFVQHLAKAIQQNLFNTKLEYPMYEPTPVFSIWPMRKKWEKFGEFWGYVLFLEERKDRSNRDMPIQMPPIQVAYAKTGTDVIQVAYWSDLKLTHD